MGRSDIHHSCSPRRTTVSRITPTVTCRGHKSWSPSCYRGLPYTTVPPTDIAPRPNEGSGLAGTTRRWPLVGGETPVDAQFPYRQNAGFGGGWPSTLGRVSSLRLTGWQTGPATR